MSVGHQVTSSTSLQIPPQPETAVLRSRHPILLDTLRPVLVQAIINPKRGMEEPLQTPQPPGSCSSPGPAGRSCWSLDARVAVLLVTLAGALILLLLYKLFQLRHRLMLARARHALEYYSFYHSATYTLKHSASCQDLPAKKGTVPEATPPVQNVTPVTHAVIAPLPPPPVPVPPPLPLPHLPSCLHHCSARHLLSPQHFPSWPSLSRCLRSTTPHPALTCRGAPAQKRMCTLGSELSGLPGSPASPTNQKSSFLSTPL
ncbi:uncharacterized protein LOC129102822 [Anoplopoma fimbria]|uniref:uncharacterized protein LOC129102822 n=1 Tax=Anoplopoma fimbria TaxID=229290 RepID=UPI0023EBE614|nr:uncharacterized protein LOC129102822 [Anoplopoma fimbria]